jgi:hypothetical protein
MIQARCVVGALLAVVVLAGCTTATHGNGTSSDSTSSAAQPPSTSAAASTTAASTSAAPTTSSATSSSAPVPTTPLRTETITAFDNSAQYVVKVWVQDETVDCEGHAYGAQVIAYLKANLCAGMTRVLASTTVGGRPVGIAQSTLGFPGGPPQSYQEASGFKELVTQNGTGNVADLLREGKRFPNSGTKVGDPDAFSAESQDAGVGVDDVWYLDGATPENDPPLLQLAQSLFLQLN